ncbi:MAG: O-methyltransferase [Lactovum sp.]
MIESYIKSSNPMMRRPIVNAEVLKFMRQEQNSLEGNLLEIQNFAKSYNIPVIPHETVVYFKLLLSLLQPQKILEIGTAIGFSTLLFAETCPEAKITSLERFEEMLVFARENFKKYDKRRQIQLLEGDAAVNLPRLQDQKFDFIFMDSAKAQYIKFLPYLLENLSDNGLLVIDDVLQAGDILKDINELPRRQHNIHKALNQLFQTVHENPKLESSLLPLGDGLLLIKCKKN